MSNAVIIKTRKFKRNPLLARKQVRPLYCQCVGNVARELCMLCARVANDGKFLFYHD